MIHRVTSIFILSLFAFPSAAFGQTPDFNENGHVEFADFLLFARAFGSDDLSSDLNGDGLVNLPDFIVFIHAFGREVPEPNLPEVALQTQFFTTIGNVFWLA